MVVLGIDPGSKVLGYGLVLEQGSQLRYLISGVLELSSKDTMEQRLAAIHLALAQIVDTHHPHQVAMEEAFSHKNVQSALVLGQVRGAVMALAGLKGVPVFHYAPRTIKKAVTGHGEAEKFQVQQMVGLLLGTDLTQRTDESDALACALCHLQNLPAQRWAAEPT